MDPFVAEIRVFPFNFAPRGWAMCDGQVLPINQNTALFSLIGTQFGGDGTTTFALPDLQGKVPIDQGSGAGLTARAIGATGGEAAVTLTTSELPSHQHGLRAFTGRGAVNVNTPPSGGALSTSPGGLAYAPPGSLQAMDPNTLLAAGGGAAHNNLMPYLTLNFCIALQGIYPARP